MPPPAFRKFVSQEVEKGLSLLQFYAKIESFLFLHHLKRLSVCSVVLGPSAVLPPDINSIRKKKLDTRTGEASKQAKKIHQKERTNERSLSPC